MCVFVCGGGGREREHLHMGVLCNTRPLSYFKSVAEKPRETRVPLNLEPIVYGGSFIYLYYNILK